MSKYVLVTSGVCSSLGKGVASASLGSLLIKWGFKVAMVKCDPYINLDAGSISPFQRGEVFVTQDGAETDGDLGNFARFTGVNMESCNSITTGKVYDTVIRNERAGKYNGRTVSVIPHITDEIKRRILNVGTQSRADVVIVEIGGTVGDIESIPFLEAARQLIGEMPHCYVCSLHISLVPEITGGELKTKPTQQSVKQLQEAGIQPDVLLCRTHKQLDDAMKKKIALFCNVSSNSVFTSTDVEHTIYELPLIFHNEGLDTKVMRRLGLESNKCSMKEWTVFCERVAHPKRTVKIAMVGKKDALDDCYRSVRESLFHAAVTNFCAELTIAKIDAESLESCAGPDGAAQVFSGASGIIVPGSTGQRGFLGLLTAVRYARENNVPYLGIDLGMQIMAVETARSLCLWADADSTEFIQGCEHPVISLPEEQAELNAAGLMKLGAGVIRVKNGTKLSAVYGTLTREHRHFDNGKEDRGGAAQDSEYTEITERHRSSRTFDRRYEKDLSSHGLIVSAEAESDRSAEAFEWTNHPWGIGVQYHPEFVSRPAKPHPLFTSFIEASLKAASVIDGAANALFNGNA